MKCKIHKTETITRKTGEGYSYQQCPQCMAEAQQVYLHRQLTPEQLDAKEIRAKAAFKRTMAAIAAVRKEREIC